MQKTAATNIKSTFGFYLRLPTVYALNILTSIEPAASATDARLQSAIHVRSAVATVVGNAVGNVFIQFQRQLPSSLYFHIITKSVPNEATRHTGSRP